MRRDHAGDHTVVQIDVGGAGDSTFLPDTYGIGGITDSKPADARSFPNFGLTVTHPVPDAVWHTSRHLESSYTVPGLTPGSYEVRLYFLDWYFRGSEKRIFDVDVNGTRVLRNFDINGTAIAAGADGPQSFGVERDIPVTVDGSGRVTIDFVRGAANQPQINAIVIVPR